MQDVLYLFFALLLIPLLRQGYLARARATKCNRLLAFTIKNIYFWVLVSAFCFLLTTRYVFKYNTPYEIELTFLEKQDFQNELDAYEVTEDTTDFNTRKGLLLWKFRYANSLWTSEDYYGAFRVLLEIVEGHDPHSTVPPVESFVVYNDLGCAQFKKGKNKALEAYDYFIKARDLAKGTEGYVSIINDNIEKLDAMLNY